jgi:hypothetical protein
MAEIEYLGRPINLCRYRSLADIDRELEAIEKSYIYCSDYLNLNDPMEGEFEHGTSLFRRNGARAYMGTFQTTLEGLGIGSFCEIHNHVLMWAHYANQHKGICIVYDFAKLRRRLPANVVFTRISYTEEKPVVRSTTRDVMALAKRVLSVKKRSWLYEREWRMFAPKGRAKYLHTSSIKFVYLGSRMAAATRRKVKTRLNAAGIVTRDMPKEDLLMAI